MIADDLDVLARTIFGEARGEHFEGQVAVAWVIKNRAARGHRFGTGIRGVCLAPKQFSCWNEDDPNREVIRAATFEDPAFLRAHGIAALVLRGDLEDPTHGADHYHTTTIWPKWAESMAVRAVIGNHKFLKEVV